MILVKDKRILRPLGWTLPWHFVSLRSAAMQPCKSSLKPSFLTLQISPFCWYCKLVHRCFHFQVPFYLYFRCLFFPGRVRLCQRSAGDGPSGFALTLDFLPSLLRSIMIEVAASVLNFFAVCPGKAR